VLSVTRRKKQLNKEQKMPRGNPKDITGKKYGLLTVIKATGFRGLNRGVTWLCKCDCGGDTIVIGSYLRSGHRKSCGCLHKRRGPDNPNWKGTKYYSRDYSYIYKPDHPNSIKSYVSEHVFVMSEHIGRKLEQGEIVHHKNGNRKDNRLENLELRLTNRHAPGQAVHDLIKYAIEILNKYAPDKLCHEEREAAK